jgi:hypothetical protein
METIWKQPSVLEPVRPPQDLGCRGVSSPHFGSSSAASASSAPPEKQGCYGRLIHLPAASKRYPRHPAPVPPTCEKSCLAVDEFVLQALRQRRECPPFSSRCARAHRGEGRRRSCRIEGRRRNGAPAPTGKTFTPWLQSHVHRRSWPADHAASGRLIGRTSATSTTG